MQKTPVQHEISLATAIELTGRYRADIPENMPICETFEKASVLRLLQTEGAAKFRIYYGQKENGEICAVLVAADADGQDILPAVNTDELPNENDEIILESSYRCPHLCPPESPLNP